MSSRAVVWRSLLHTIRLKATRKSLVDDIRQQHLCTTKIVCRCKEYDLRSSGTRRTDNKWEHPSR